MIGKIHEILHHQKLVAIQYVEFLGTTVQILSATLTALVTRQVTTAMTCAAIVIERSSNNYGHSIRNHTYSN